MESAATKTLIGDIVRNALYVLLGAGALWAFVRLVRGSADDVIQTGVPGGSIAGRHADDGTRRGARRVGRRVWNSAGCRQQR